LEIVVLKIPPKQLPYLAKLNITAFNYTIREKEK
jgi:hypothetical protein